MQTPKKILIVEDDYIIAAHLKVILSKEGYNMLDITDCVTDAISIIAADTPDLVIIDIELQNNKRGTELGEFLLSSDTIPYIYITSYFDKATMEDVKKTRPHGFIAKPFKTADVITTVDVVLSNFKFKKIDVTRTNEQIENDIPLRIKEVINYINNNITEKIEVGQLARLTRWKKQHFTRVFSQYIGMAPYQFILKCKIEKAESLLTFTSLSVANVAEELCFSSAANFCTAFKHQTGMSPDQYRKKQQANIQLNNTM